MQKNRQISKLFLVIEMKLNMFQAYHMIQLKTETSRDPVTKLQLTSFDRMTTKQETTIKIES